MRRMLPFLAIVGLSLVCVGADYLLKRASESEHPLRSRAFLAGAALYGLTAFGWVYVLRHTKLATVGALYGVVVVIMLAVVGLVAFRESLSAPEYVGIACAVAALILLGRFA